MLIATATSKGLQTKIQQKVSAFQGDIVVAPFDSNQTEISLHPIESDQTFVQQLPEGITHLQKVAYKAGVIKTQQSFQGIVFKGVGEDFRWTDFSDFLIEGRFPKINDQISIEVMLSKQICQQLHLKLGDRFTTYFLKDQTGVQPSQRRFEVVGIYDTGFADFDETYVFGDLKQIQRLNNWTSTQVGQFELFVQDQKLVELLTQRLYDQTNNTLVVNSIKDRFPEIFGWLALFDMNVLVIVIIMVLVGGMNMITALLVLVLERTQMIGVLQVLGNQQKNIRKIFLYNAAYLICLGLFWGNLVGFALLFLQKATGFVSLDPTTYYVTQLPVRIEIYSVLLINIGTLFFCMLMLWIPSFVVSKIKPIQVLKFD